MITVDDALAALKFPHTLNYEKRAEIRDLIAAMSRVIGQHHRHRSADDRMGHYQHLPLYGNSVMFLRGDDDAR